MAAFPNQQGHSVQKFRGHLFQIQLPVLQSTTSSLFGQESVTES